ncbi:glycosyltransferase [Oscillatoria sp. CS-180]|uniref:glycosyltransferase family 4 protein n=1 Tax=Oscillatoria sp. CS-180 TaxID=3021720 RepID=UPI00232B2B4C|nr:glycosyltransferase [Oscillatoria sp. CS-180]MDB9528708.1 glycosyltransferase [Oscillatoria sp. CS-180]
MKILIQHRHGEEISGVTTYVNFLLPELAQLDTETKVISTKTDSIQSWISAIKWCDIVHMNSNHLGFVILCKIFRKKVVIKYHFPFYKTTHLEYIPYSFSQRLWHEIKSLWPKKRIPLKWKLFALINYSRLLIRVATACIGDSHIACSDFLGRSLDFPWPVKTIYNPIAISPNSVKTREDLLAPLTLTFVGRIADDKGIDILLMAVSRIAQSSAIPFCICIIGDGPGMEKMKKLAQDLNLSEQVDFKGRLLPEELMPIVSKSLALVVPSRIQDPAPYVVMEASVMSTCSIVAQAGGLPEVAGPSGLSFERENVDDLAKLLAYALQNPDDLLNRGNQAYIHTQENFSTAATAQQLVSLLQANLQAS